MRYRYILEKLNKDITLKLAAAFSAILLWFIVLNINDPYIDKTLYVELDVKNENILMEKNLYLVNRNYRKSIEVIIRGRKSAVNNVSSADFEATLDFSKVKSVNDKLISIDGPYYLKNDKLITITGVNPKSIAIELENLVKSDFPINVEFKGVPKTQYKVIAVRTEPEFVTIQDRESLVNIVGQVKALVDINGIDKDKKVIKQPCVVYNKDGEEIVSLSNSFTVDIYLEVGKEVPLVPVIEGEPAKDYVYTGYSLKNEKVTVKGSYETLAELNELKTAVININGINQSKSYAVPVNIPEGVQIIGGKNEFNVDVYVEKLMEKELVIKKEDIDIVNANRDNQFKYDILTEEASLVIKGRQQYLNEMTVSRLEPYVDVNGLGEGTYELKLQFITYANVESVNIPKIEVKISTVETEQESNSENTSAAEESRSENNE